jgi:cytidyltransferase-like protein
MNYIYKHAILGGTFDHLHLGHQRLIAEAIALASLITIGVVTSPKAIEKNYQISLESYDTRLANLRSFIESLGASDRVIIIPISDIYGTSLTDQSIDSIFVTQATLPNANLIISKRIKLNLPSIHIHLVQYALSSDNQIISSSLIRSGTIDRDGFSYLQFLESKTSLQLPTSLRSSLKQPLGTVITDLTNLSSLLIKESLIISVGDITSRNLIDSGISPSVAIIDSHTRRKKIQNAITNKYFPVNKAPVHNESGTINPKFGKILIEVLEEFYNTKKMQVIHVDGEEDLLTLPTLLLSPLNAYVMYGLYGVGMCVVQVSSGIKNLAKNYLTEF